jgi:hypothetical protein
LDLELWIDLLSVFEVMEPQRNFMKKPFKLGEYKLTWMLTVTFLHCTSIIYMCVCVCVCVCMYIYIKYTYFVTLMKYILELL